MNGWYVHCADNKGQHSVNMSALRSVIETRGRRLGFNAKYLIEMGEGTGSLGLRDICSSHKELFKADLLVAWTAHGYAPSGRLFSGSRGNANFDLTIEARKGGHHSGNWGGLISTPVFSWRTRSPASCHPPARFTSVSGCRASCRIRYVVRWPTARSTAERTGRK